ncbi:MAG: hypothetical protein Q7T15_01150 [Microcella sp.]|uniref:hypothetical protein n=1 Tax=Microcella sp. TaxID=1913979 RepID=UPI0027186A4E|nr:hypothetical protein [Microcella sp.]MDO8336844.1 hypothetical protein [Microcella sp.]
MKTAISLPDELFTRAERAAASRGISRSQLYASAVARYLDELGEEQETREIDVALALADYRADPALSDSGLGRLSALTEDDDW